ncbi:MAG: SRPBCC family protein [Caldilineales bacterium]|nr:SRPBCC family protein [Caldilineales bacterium]
MTDYSFSTLWRIRAPIDPVWEAIYDSERWPRWWQGVEAAELLQGGDSNGVGARLRYTWKSKLPYRLVFNVETTRVERPHELEGRASGELAGTGLWRLSQDGDVTTVQYDWNVRTTRRWMNLFAPIARPIFESNHNIVMSWGGEGLARLLEAPLISIEHRVNQVG